MTVALREMPQGAEQRPQGRRQLTAIVDNISDRTAHFPSLHYPVHTAQKLLDPRITELTITSRLQGRA